MTKIKFYCVTNKKVDFLKSDLFHFCWVGDGQPPKNYLTCNDKDNIFDREKFYSELTFHYWYWKNILCEENKNQWIGFCQKRRYWVKSNYIEGINKFNLEKNILKTPNDDWDKFDAIICRSINVSNVKKIKMIKRGFKNILKDPLILFDKNRQNLSLHFDMHHGYGNLQKAIKKLDNRNQIDFENFVKNNNTFNPHIMFIAKPEIINLWFEELFKWLFHCEEEFNFEKLKGYDTGRLFAYLAERYLSYWFTKNLKCKEENWVELDNF